MWWQTASNGKGKATHLFVCGRKKEHFSIKLMRVLILTFLHSVDKIQMEAEKKRVSFHLAVLILIYKAKRQD
jgi:hypothetical protein